MTRPPIIILAGGQGTRLREVTGPDIPKPMVDIFGKPFLYWLVLHYYNQGFRDIIISTGYKATAIEQYSWPCLVSFEHDRDTYNGFEWVYNQNGWVVNGDTFIPDTLPEGLYDKRILVHNDLDAGAQYVSQYGKIYIEPCSGFYDIGTPKGLERFKEYFKTHPLYLTHCKE